MRQQVETPPEGTQRLTLCPSCRRRTSHRAVYLRAWDDGSEESGRQFAGWQCDDCGTEHSGS